MAYDFTPYTMQQNYAQYTAEDFEVWRILFNRQMTHLPAMASKEYWSSHARARYPSDSRCAANEE